MPAHRWTAKFKAEFLWLLTEMTIVAACKQLNVDRTTLYDEYKRDPLFKEQVKEAKLFLVDKFHQAQFDTIEQMERGELDAHQAKVKISTLQWNMEKTAPKEWGNKVDVTSGGERIESPPPVIIDVSKLSTAELEKIYASSSDKEDAE